MKNLTIITILLCTSFATATYPDATTIKSWKTIRDFNVVKQQVDYSCGLASLATILNNVFHENLTEAIILDEFAKMKNIQIKDLEKEEKYSLLDIKNLAELKGYKATGLKLDFENLKKIISTVPVIAYINPKGIDHFTVVNSISDQCVFLADPSWGNIKMTHLQFIEIWKTDIPSKQYGKILIITKKS